MSPLIHVHDVIKDYKGLRPLRLRELRVEPEESVAISGFDAAAAAVLVDLLTGAALPDAGEVRIDGRSTADLSTHDDWLAFLEQFGLVNDRVVLLDGLSVAQNLAVPLTLDLDPLGPRIRAEVEGLAGVVGLEPGALDRAVAAVSALDRFRVKLGRAVAHRPRILLLEHPTVGLSAADVARLAGDIVGVGQQGPRSVLTLTGDPQFARRLRGRTLVWHPATGVVESAGGWRRWFG